MTITTVASGTQVAVISTEHELDSSVSNGTTRVCQVDLSNMVDGDKLTIRAYNRVDGTNDRLELADFVANEPNTLVISLVIVTDQNIRYTLEQTAGTGRSFPFRVLDL